MRGLLGVVVLVAVLLAGCAVDPETVSGKLVTFSWHTAQGQDSYLCRVRIEPVNGNEQSSWSYYGYNQTVCIEASALVGRCVLLYHEGIQTRNATWSDDGLSDGIAWTHEDTRGCGA